MARSIPTVATPSNPICTLTTSNISQVYGLFNSHGIDPNKPARTPTSSKTSMTWHKMKLFFLTVLTASMTLATSFELPPTQLSLREFYLLAGS